MKHHYSAVYGEVTIRPLERKDIENLRIWRNDASQTRFLRNIGHITRENGMKDICRIQIPSYLQSKKQKG